MHVFWKNFAHLSSPKTIVLISNKSVYMSKNKADYKPNSILVIRRDVMCDSEKYN